MSIYNFHEDQIINKIIIIYNEKTKDKQIVFNSDFKLFEYFYCGGRPKLDSRGMLLIIKYDDKHFIGIKTDELSYRSELYNRDNPLENIYIYIDEIMGEKGYIIEECKNIEEFIKIHLTYENGWVGSDDEFEPDEGAWACGAKLDTNHYHEFKMKNPGAP